MARSYAAHAAGMSVSYTHLDVYKRQAWRGQGVVTPHAAALAVPIDPEAALANLAALEGLGCYGPGGLSLIHI